MEKSIVIRRIREVGVLPVLRAGSVELAMQLAEAIAEGGITAIEVTMTVPGAIDVIRRLVKERPDLLIGAGTVLDPETARTCILEGAEFVVSPALNIATIELCHRYSVAVLPGALTPTEIVTAWQAGADLIKVFPASAMGGAKYLRSLKAPLPQIELIPTGGVSLANVGEFFAAGAFAVGVGADLVDERSIREGRRESVVETARSYAASVREYRTPTP
ncbi:MAG TPA: bifunctional 2-keto-4-hydroxyglutarate aldolase/2-keto-3-deoxy-6-phosphogluconate aldolase [Granulicella sp.]